MESMCSEFHPKNYSDVPLYNIQAVAASTGVPAITLRSWERRYGAPEPKRDVKGYRLYSDRDIAVTRWLRERVRQGVGISRAVNMLRALERGELLAEPTRAFDFEALGARLLEAMARLDENAINHTISEALTVAGVEEVALELLQPALYEVGTRWAAGTLSVTCEHVGSHVIRSYLAQLVRLMPPPLRNERVLVGCAPGELHDIGALMLALFLRRRGFDVVYAGASMEPSCFEKDMRAVEPSAICLSAGSPAAAEAVHGSFTRLRRWYPGVLAFGGRAYNEDRSWIERSAGCFLGPDADTASRNLEARFAR